MFPDFRVDQKSFIVIMPIELSHQKQLTCALA
jgi:hypothetical protein